MIGWPPRFISHGGVNEFFAIADRVGLGPAVVLSPSAGTRPQKITRIS